MGPRQQEPGTILFGSALGDPLESYSGWPCCGITVGYPWDFGAYWGYPVGEDEIRVTLYRALDGTLSLVWTDVKAIDATATGYLDDIVPFEDAGIYRLEVTVGPEPIASTLVRLNPPCTKNCSGG